MTDKVQRIKEWISKTQDGLMDDNGNFENTSDEGAFHILSNLDYYIDSLQEEPEPQFKVGDIIRSKVWKSAVHEIVSMDGNAYYFENDGIVRFTDQELWELVEEPVSEDLEKVAEEAAVAAFFVSPQWTKTGERLFKAGAQWQERQMIFKAIDAKLLEGHLIRQKGVTHPLHVGDKVKVIVIKED